MENADFQFADREMPRSIEAEQSILGAVLADPSVLPLVVEKIKPEYFYSQQHKSLYNIIMRMFTSGSNADIITVLNEAEKLHIFETAAEGRRYLANLAEILPSTANIESYCRIVAEKYYIRSLSYAARSILQDVQSGEHNAQILLDSAEQKIYDIREGRNVQGLVPISDAVSEAYDKLGKIAGPDKEKYIGARTGFTYLDSITSGLNKSDLIILAARPAMGKTSFAMNIATNVARRSEKDVVVFNLEMSKDQLATRLLSTEALVDSNSLRNGRISNDDWVRLATSAGYLSSLPLFIDDTASMTVPQMKAKLRRTKNLGLVIIDYLQLMDSTSKSDNRVVVISEITRQLSRGVESRTDKRPMLSDLRESGSIEQDADIVLFLYRDAYYNKESTRQNISECIVAKNRHGETGTVELIWDGQFTRFSNPDFQTKSEPA